MSIQHRPGWGLLTWHRQSHLWRGTLNWGNTSFRSASRHVGGTLSWLTWGVRGPISLWVVPCLAGDQRASSKASWASRGDEVNKQHYLVASASVPASWFLLDFSQGWTGTREVILAMGPSQQPRTLSKTPCNMHIRVIYIRITYRNMSRLRMRENMFCISPSYPFFLLPPLSPFVSQGSYPSVFKSSTHTLLYKCK